MKKRARRRLFVLSTIAMLMLVVLVFVFSRSAGDQLSPYHRAQQNHLRLTGGRVSEVITLTDPLNGALIVVNGETVRSTGQDGVQRMREERVASMGDRTYYEASYYDGENYYVSNETGWLIFGGEYYKKFVKETPFDRIGPGFDPDEVSGTRTTADEEGTRLTVNLSTSQPAVPLQLPMYSGNQLATFRAEQVEILINNQKLIAEMTYTGQVNVEFPDRIDHYGCTMEYIVSEFNEKFELSLPVIPVPEEWQNTLQRIRDERAAEKAGASS